MLKRTFSIAMMTLLLLSVIMLAFAMQQAKAQGPYTITFNQTGIGTDYTGTVVTVNGTDYTASELPAYVSCNSGDTLNFNFISPLVVPGAEEYVWNSTDGLSSLQSDTITVTAAGNVTGNYLMHEVEVTNIASDQPWIYYDHGFGANINVTVLDDGDFNETVTVTLYYNITANDVIGTRTLNVSTGQNGIAAFTWNATGNVAYPQNYTMTAVASIPEGINNTFTGGIIGVRIPGDILNEGIVNIYDAIAFSNYFGLKEGEPGWNPDADLLHDGIIDIFDMILLASYFGQTGSP